MPKYICPDCQTVIRREEPVPEGKRLRCPECETVFQPRTAVPARERAAQKQKPAEQPKKSSSAPPEEEEGGTYSVVQEPETKGKKGKKEAAVKYEELRKKFPKSKIGPAMALTVRPSNRLLFLATLLVLTGLFTLVYGFWPLVYADHKPVGSKVTERILIMIAGVFDVCLGGFIAYAASCLHELTNKGICWAGAIVGIPPGLFWTIEVGLTMATFQSDNAAYYLGAMTVLIFFLLVGLGMLALPSSALVALQNPAVKEGFEEVLQGGPESLKKDVKNDDDDDYDDDDDD